MPLLTEGWRTGEWIWAVVAALCVGAALALWVRELFRGWTPLRMWREFYHEAKQSKAEGRARSTVYEFGPGMGLALVLLIAAGFAFVVGSLQWSR